MQIRDGVVEEAELAALLPAPLQQGLAPGEQIARQGQHQRRGRGVGRVRHGRAEHCVGVHDGQQVRQVAAGHHVVPGVERAGDGGVDVLRGFSHGMSPLSGLKEIRKAFEALIKIFPTNGSTFKVIKTAVKDDLFYIVWSAKTPVVEYTYATDSFIIQGGKILRQTFKN